MEFDGRRCVCGQSPTAQPTFEPTASPTAAPTDEPTAVSNAWDLVVWTCRLESNCLNPVPSVAFGVSVGVAYSRPHGTGGRAHGDAHALPHGVSHGGREPAVLTLKVTRP
jgi:hypothetical protein